MAVPVQPPVSPMLARLARELPPGGGWSYEPKWDGFRCVVFRDGDDVELGSRNERPLNRYFPEILDPLRAALPAQAVVDGELVIATPHGLDFDLLSLRIHPAASRVDALAADTPASFVAFDALAEQDTDLRPRPFVERRERLEAMVANVAPVHVTPATTDPAVATRWFDEFEGAGLDGIVAKALDSPYREGERTMVKVKHQRTADCVVAGSRTHKDGRGVGSLLLGLYDDAGALHHVGVASSFAAPLRARLVDEVAPYRAGRVAATIRGATGRVATPAPPGCRARRADGTRRRTCPGSRCGPSSSPRSPTSTSRATGSATPPASSAGGPTGTPGPAPTTSWRLPCLSSCARCSGSDRPAGRR